MEDESPLSHEHPSTESAQDWFLENMPILSETKMNCEGILSVRAKKKLQITDLYALNDIFAKIHGDSSDYKLLNKEKCDEYAYLIMEQCIENRRRIEFLEQKIHSETYIDAMHKKATNEECRDHYAQQLILLSQGVFGLLDHRFIVPYLNIISLLDTKNEDTREFLYDFFQNHSFSHVCTHANVRYESFLKNHLKFLLSHFVDMEENTFAFIQKIAIRSGIEEEYPDFMTELGSIVQPFHSVIWGLSVSVRNRFFHIQRSVVLSEGELFYRNTLHRISKDDIWCLPDDNNPTMLLSYISLACVYSQNSLVATLVSQIQPQKLSLEDFRYIGLLLYETGYHSEAIKILIDYGDLTDADVLECIFRAGISYPEWTGDMLNLFHKRLASFGIEPIGLSWFVAELKKDVRDWKRTDISSQGVSHLLSLAYWAEGQSCIFLSRGKDWNYINRAWEAYSFCYAELKNVLLGMFPDYPKLPDVLSEAEVKILSDYGHYLSNHSLEQEETLHIFEYLDEVLDDGRYLDVIFNTSLILWDFSKARSSLRKMDEKGVIDTGPLWIIYHMSSDDLDMKIQAVRLYIDADRETRSLLDKETIFQIKNFARNLYEEYRLNSKRSEEENDRFMFLYRAQAIELNHDITTAVRYWQEIARLLKNGDVEVLQKLYLSITHPTDYAFIRLTDSEEKDNLQKLLIGLQMDARVFYGAFLSDLQISELLYEITSIFRDFPDGLWLWFLLEWRRRHESSIVNCTKEQYGSVHVMDAPIFLQ